MRIDHKSRSGRLLLALGGRLLRLIFWALIGTCRYRIVAGREILEAARAAGQPLILSFWHNQTFLAADFLVRRIHRAGLPMTLLASQSRDGELVTQMVKSWGIETVRGSSTRGGREALRTIHRAIKQRGSSPILVPDGPHGPLYHFKVGAAVLAQTSGAPILPLAFAATSAWRLKSWDRLLVPRPFCRIDVVIGAPQYLAPDLMGAALEQERQRLEELLNLLAAQAATPPSSELPS